MYSIAPDSHDRGEISNVSTCPGHCREAVWQNRILTVDTTRCEVGEQRRDGRESAAGTFPHVRHSSTCKCPEPQPVLGTRLGSVPEVLCGQVGMRR